MHQVENIFLRQSLLKGLMQQLNQNPTTLNNGFDALKLIDAKFLKSVSEKDKLSDLSYLLNEMGRSY